jgi:hypothetical protein
MAEFPAATETGLLCVCAARSQGRGVAGIGADDHGRVPGVGRRLHRAHPRRSPRRRRRLPPLPLLPFQVEQSNDASFPIPAPFFF